MLKVLIACEESQRVCMAFRNLGCEAYSCDIQEPSGAHPEYHIQTNALELINGYCLFATLDGKIHSCVTHSEWNLIIAHPPCTRLCSSGQRWLYYGTPEYRAKKMQEQREAIEFFMRFVNAKCNHIAIENPVGIMSTVYRRPDCIYNPFDFKGETECKRTCLWLKNLPPLRPTQNLSKHLRTHNLWNAKFDKQYSYNDPIVSKLRSKTPLGVANAMAEQWVHYLTAIENSPNNL